jgi:hypothetical protein
MAFNDYPSRLVQTDLATMISIMQELCPDDQTIIACVEEMMHKGVIRKTSFHKNLCASA